MDNPIIRMGCHWIVEMKRMWFGELIGVIRIYNQVLIEK